MIRDAEKVFAVSLVLSCCCSASVPLRWQVETSRLQPVAFDALHGETLELSASFQSYGKPLAVTGPAALYYQTNGMGSAWWQVPATVASNRIEAVFTPADDPGAPRLNCFLGGTASTYRAAFALRFAPSPGAKPNELPIPPANYDSDLIGEPKINGTNLIDFVANRAADAENSARAYADALYLSVTNDVCNIVTNEIDAVEIISAEEYNTIINTNAPLAISEIVSFEYIRDGDVIFEDMPDYASTSYWRVVWKSDMFGGTRTGYDIYAGPGSTSIYASPDAAQDWGVKVRLEKRKINALGLATLDDLPDMSNYVPTTRLVAGKPLTSNVTLGPADVGALPVDGTAKEAFFALESSSAKEADFAYKARDAEIANYALMAGGVSWYDIGNRPTWIGTEKPSYTAIEVGATTPEDVTAAIREQSLGGIWDAELQVWWTPRMRNGSLTYEATTNVNLNAEN